jgi:hypothetical protein
MTNFVWSQPRDPIGHGGGVAGDPPYDFDSVRIGVVEHNSPGGNGLESDLRRRPAAGPARGRGINYVDRNRRCNDQIVEATTERISGRVVAWEALNRNARYCGLRKSV